MNEEEKKAIEILKNKRPSEQMLISGKMCVDILLNLIEKQQKELEKKDKIIDKMALYIAGCDTDEDICKEWKPNNSCEDNGISCKECLIEYFEKKVGE